MRPTFLADVGNSRFKLAKSEPDGPPTMLVADAAFRPEAWAAALAPHRVGEVTWAATGVNPPRLLQLVQWIASTGDPVLVIDRPVQVPIAVDGPVREQVGVDRLLDCLAALHLRRPGDPTVVVGAGSALVVNGVNAAGAFVGGAIAPGLRLLARSLHEFTAGLPLVEAGGPIAGVGRTTQEAIRLGCYQAFVGAMEEMARNMKLQLARLGNLDSFEVNELLLTGGDAAEFDWAFHPLGVWRARLVPTLTLYGLQLTAEARSVTVRVARLTPAGTGAIATLAVAGPGALGLVRPHFRRPGGRPLPEAPAAGALWLGRLSFDGETGDEVVLTQRSAEWVEVHAHGGPLVVRVLLDGLVRAGAVEVPGVELAAEWPAAAGADARALAPLTHAPTARAAGVLLDQFHGAFARTVVEVVAARDLGKLTRLAELAGVGAHLVEPWRVALAGPPNVGKSRLMNALAGFARSVVADVAGTTRDVVVANLAFDGWPVALADTAGLRDGLDDLEAAGIALTRDTLDAADLVLWVADTTEAAPAPPPALAAPMVVAANKTDLSGLRNFAAPGAFAVCPVSAATGAGLPELQAALVRALVPAAPEPGEAVPFTPGLAAAVRRAHALAAAGDWAGAANELSGGPVARA